MTLIDIDEYPSPQHARWAQGTEIEAAIHTIVPVPENLPVHPTYENCLNDWIKWRLVYESGDLFIDEYLKRFSRRERRSDFNLRRAITPIPAFAAAAINEIKNAIFQRMEDITRVGGPPSYRTVINGNNGGVDLKRASMNFFLGQYVLPELLTMKKVGIYVDNGQQGPTLANHTGVHPYLYTYKAENILNWNEVAYTGEQSPVLVRDYIYIYDEATGLPKGEKQQYRRMYKSNDGFIHVEFYDEEGNVIRNVALSITKIPFHCIEISESLLKNVANHQIALLNMESSDIAYSLKGNFPFYTEQYDPRSNNYAIRAGQQAYNDVLGDGSCPPNQPRLPEANVGSTQGRRYPLGAERPAFIHPSSEPLKISMEKQLQLKYDIRTLVQLALSNVTAVRTSAEARDKDQQGLESGLSYIGLALEHAERQIASFWAMYEGTKDEPEIKYPKRWSLKSFEQVLDEVTKLKAVREDIPSTTFKREVNKQIARALVGLRVSDSTIETIEQELDESKGTSSDPKTIIGDVEAGILSIETACILRSYPETESEQAKLDHAERLARIAAAQSSGGALHSAANKKAAADLAVELSNPAARGVPDLAVTPADMAAQEKVGKPVKGTYS